MAVAAHRAPFGVDAAAARQLNAAKGSVAFDIAGVVSWFGLAYVLVPMGIGIGVVAYRRLRRRLPAASVVIASAAAGLAEVVAKEIIRRPRPPTAVLTHTGGFAFPSGHTTAATAFAVACVGIFGALGERRRGVVIAAAGMALAVGASRVVLGAHWLSDVIGGLLLGTAVGVLVSLLTVRRISAWRG